MSQQNQIVKALSVALTLAFLGSACNSTSIPGVQNFNVAVQTESGDPHLYAAFEATALAWKAGIIAPIPGLKNATVGISPGLPTNGQPEGTVFQFDVDLATLGYADYALAGLPDGRGLPDIDGGELPRWQFSIQQQEFDLYLSSTVFGIFIPINLEGTDGATLPDTLSMEIDDSKGNLVGKVYAIPTAGGGTNSGLLFLIPFTANTQPAQANSILN